MTNAHVYELQGQAMFTGRDTGLTRLVYPEVSDLDYPRYV